jgi:hypothetical protein
MQSRQNSPGPHWTTIASRGVAHDLLDLSLMVISSPERMEQVSLVHAQFQVPDHNKLIADKGLTLMGATSADPFLHFFH